MSEQARQPEPFEPVEVDLGAGSIQLHWDSDRRELKVILQGRGRLAVLPRSDNAIAVVRLKGVDHG